MRRFTAKDKKKVLDLMYGGMSKNALANLLGIERKEITIWDLRYKQDGMQGLEPLPARRRFTQPYKRQVVREHIRDKKTTRELCVKYGISLSSLKNWVRQYKDVI